MKWQSPTLRIRRLAGELERLHRQSGRSAEQIAQTLGWSRQKVSRLVTGDMKMPQVKEIAALLDIYAVPASKREEILELVRQARQRGWWYPHRDIIGPGYESYIAFEAEATVLRCWESFVLPGLFQTPAYTRALIASRVPDRPREHVERLVTVRTERQRILTGTHLRKLWVVLDEAVLWRQFGQPQVMIEQLEHLRKVADAPERYAPQVGIQILPFTAARQPASGPFTLMTFAHPLDEEVVYMETAGGQAWLEQPEEADKIRLAWEQLVAAALPAADTLSVIDTVMEKIKQQGAAHAAADVAEKQAE